METITIGRLEYDSLNEALTRLEVIQELLETVDEDGYVTKDFVKILKTVASLTSIE